MAATVSSTVVMTTTPQQPTLQLNSAKTGQTKETLAIQFRDCYNGIGIKVIGGRSEGVAHGLFIKRLIAEGKAQVDGRLKVGDELLRVNGQPLEGSTYPEALRLLREAAASGQVTLVVSRDRNSQKEFSSLMEDELTTASESSRATTPLNTFDSSHSSNSTLISEGSSQSPQVLAPRSNQSQAAMNNNQGGLTRTFSQNSANRQEIQRLANIFSHKLPGTEAMASTPYDASKSSHQHQTGRMNLTSRPQRAHHQPDSLFAQVADETEFAQQLLTSIHSDTQRSSPLRGASHTPALPSDQRCPLEKLETALKFLGLNLSHEQKMQLRSMLSVDSQGLVSYSQFVQLAKQLFQDDLRQWEAPPATFNVDKTHVEPGLPIAAQTTHSSQASELSEEVRQLQKENFELRRQIHSLSRRLSEQMQLTSNSEKSLHKFRAEAQQALQESTTLHEKLQLAAESQKLASQQEQEYERVIQGLEQEINMLKENEAKQLESPSVRKKLTIMGAQLRKSEASRKTYAVATQKLLDQCQQVYETLSGRVSSTRYTPQHLAEEVMDTMNLVRSLLERDPLPFGWEECYDEDGARYFINHVTHETSWQHPVTRQDPPSGRRIC